MKITRMDGGFLNQWGDFNGLAVKFTTGQDRLLRRHLGLKPRLIHRVMDRWDALFAGLRKLLRSIRPVTNRTATRNGLDASELAATSYAVYQGLLQTDAPKWSSVQEADRIPWMEVAVFAINSIDIPESEQAEVQVSAKMFGKVLFNQFTLARGLEPNFASEPLPVQLSWETVGRHLANLIDSDGAQDVVDLENRAITWAHDQIGKRINQ